MEYQVLKPGDVGYPARLSERLGESAPALSCKGPRRLLDRFTIAVAASDLIPAQAVMATHQLLFTIREYALNYIGGWHSVMETEIFRIALDRKTDAHGTRSLTMFSARGLDHESWEDFLADRFGDKGPFTGFPEKEEYRRRARDGELLVLSLTEPSMKKMTHGNIMARNLAACALADVVFIPFSEKGTKTYTLCKRVLERRIPIFATQCEANQDLLDLGVPLLDRKTVRPFLETMGARIENEAVFLPNHVSEPTGEYLAGKSGDVKASSNQFSLLAKD